MSKQDNKLNVDCVQFDTHLDKDGDKGESGGTQPTPLCSSCEAFLAVLLPGSRYGIASLLRHLDYIHEADQLDLVVDEYQKNRAFLLHKANSPKTEEVDNGQRTDRR